MFLFDGHTDPNRIMHQRRTPTSPSDEPDRSCRQRPGLSGRISWIVEAQSLSSKSNRFERLDLGRQAARAGAFIFLGKKLLATLLALA